MKSTPAAMGADARRFDSRCRRVVRYALALLSQRRSDPLFDAAVRLSGHSLHRPRRRRDSVRDRYFAGLDAGVRRCSVFQVVGLRGSDLARRSERRRSLRGPRSPQRRSRRPHESALACCHARHDGRLSRARFHHGIGDGLHELRRIPTSLSDRRSSSAHCRFRFFCSLCSR